MDNKQILRDFRLNIIDNSVSQTCNFIWPDWKYFLLNPKRRILKSLLKHGVLVGSRALACYKINGKPSINRNPRDWDIVMTRDKFNIFCKEHKIYDVDLSSRSYHLDKSLVVIRGTYSPDTKVFPCDIEVIIRDIEPNYIESNGVKIAELYQILYTKVDLIDSLKNSKSYIIGKDDDIGKHQLNKTQLKEFEYAYCHTSRKTFTEGNWYKIAYDGHDLYHILDYDNWSVSFYKGTLEYKLKKVLFNNTFYTKEEYRDYKIEKILNKD